MLSYRRGGVYDAKIYVYDLAINPPALRWTLTDATNIVYSVAFSGDSRWLAAGGLDDNLRL